MKPAFASRVWRDWSRELPAERIRYWFLDDIVARPSEVREEICDFIGAAAGPGSVAANHNRKENNAKIPMPPEIRKRLIDFFASEYDDCARIFGGHAIAWRDQAMSALR
jgi:hypothetical protein